MNTMMVLMNCRTHKELYASVLRELPATFGYEFASILFSEDSVSLYAMDGEVTNTEGGDDKNDEDGIEELMHSHD